MEQKVIDHPDLMKVDHSFVVNINHTQYEAAKNRVRTSRRFEEMDQRLSYMEQTLSSILTLLQNGGRA